MSLSLSGFLPGENHDGLSRVAPRLIELTEAVLDGQADRDAADVVVIAILRGHSVKRKRATDDDDDPRVTVEARIRHVELVEGAEADQVRSMLTRLQDSRASATPLPGMPGSSETEDMPDPTNVVDPDHGEHPDAARRAKRKAKGKVDPPPFGSETDAADSPPDPIPPLPPRRDDDK